MELTRVSCPKWQDIVNRPELRYCAALVRNRGQGAVGSRLCRITDFTDHLEIGHDLLL
jgi:hypothetical protein